MITTPVICRFRKLGCAVTAKVKLRLWRRRARQLAVLICHSSDGGFRAGGVRVPVRIGGGGCASRPLVLLCIPRMQLKAGSWAARVAVPHHGLGSERAVGFRPVRRDRVVGGAYPRNGR